MRRWIGPALILLSAAVATSPILLHRPFCGDDFEFHIVSWFDVNQSWRHGVLYPHWLQAANFGAGEPRYMFYSPLTWVLGAALGFVLPWQAVPAALVFLLLAGTGLATRKLALELLPDGAATLAGCATLFTGFALFTAYERTAFAELTGGFWIPLLLLFALRQSNPEAGFWRRVLDGSTLPLALLVAGCWLSNGPAGVMATYLLAFVAITACILTRSLAPVVRTGVATVLGISLGAFFLFPAASEQSWADLHAATDYPVFQIENNWLFAHHTDAVLAPFAPFLHRTSVLATFMVTLALLSGTALLLRSRGRCDNSRRAWWVVLALIPLLVLLLQFPVSLIIWNSLPKLRFLQYPWRWLLVLEAPAAILFVGAVWPNQDSRPWRRTALGILCGMAFLAVTFAAGKTFLRACKVWETLPSISALYYSGRGLEGTDEYEPPDADHWQIAKGLPDACLTTDSDTVLGLKTGENEIPVWNSQEGSCEAVFQARERNASHLRISGTVPDAGFLVLRLSRYPAWKVTLNGLDPGELPERDDGLIAIPVQKGPVDLKVDWTATPDVIAGRAMSLVGLVLLVGVGFLERRNSRPRL